MSRKKVDVVIENTSVVDNNTKTNESVETLLTVNELKKFFVENGIIPKYSDSTHYVGFGTRHNMCSVHALKTKYNLYVDNTVFETVNGTVNDVEYIENGNSSDHTRPNMIIAKTTEQLKSLFTVCCENIAGITL